MLFATLNTQTTQAISACEELIVQLKQQLASAQEKLGQLNQQQQGELTAQATAQTALEMVAKARRMIQVAYPNCPEAMTEFNQALMEGLPPTEPDFTQYQLMGNISDETDSYSPAPLTPEPPLPTVPQNQSEVIEPQVIDIPEVPQNGYHRNGNSHNSNGQNLSHTSLDSVAKPLIILTESDEPKDISTLTLDELKVLPRNQLQALATSKRVATNGNRLHIAKRLQGMVTAQDLEALTIA